MNENHRKIRVAQWGLGAMGQGVARLIQAKEGLELVAAFDINPALAGKDVHEVLGGEPTGIRISDDPTSLLDPDRIDVVTIATTSWVERQLPDLKRLLAAGINVVSIAEEMAAPEAQSPQAAAELDALAKDNGVSIIGVGVNPGFVLDHLVVVLSAGSQDVTHIEARRVNDLSPYGETVLTTQGVGTTPEEFEAGVADGSIVGHVGFPESVRLISDALGLGVDRVEQTLEAIIATAPRQARDRVIAPGLVAGCNHIAVGYRGNDEVIRLIHPQQVDPGAEGVSTGDYITISGVPEVQMTISPEIAGGKATAGIAVNTIPRIFAATPGLKRIIDLPSPCALMGPEAYERR
ncbi:MAG: 2,4-diaminopentanoate dehydrogenase [Propionibacteriaceae bacterium]|nr:2,4-diaminopentanoate dehydrogenase [Propionibacteriaceae bacterium]